MKQTNLDYCQKRYPKRFAAAVPFRYFVSMIVLTFTLLPVYSHTVKHYDKEQAITYSRIF